MNIFKKNFFLLFLSIGITLSVVSCNGSGSPAPVVKKPVFSHSAGTHGQDINITISCPTEGASVYYTINGTTPTNSSFLFSEGDTIELSGDGESITITAIALKSGYTDSDIISDTFSIDYEQVSVPTLSLVTGIYALEREVTIETTTSGAEIRYTLDGSEPTISNGTVYIDTPIYIAEETEIKVKAFKEGFKPSDLVETSYDITYNWGRSFGGTGEDKIKASAIDNSGNIFVVGNFYDTVDFGASFGGTDEKTSAGDSDIFITRIRNDGTYDATLTLGGNGTDTVSDIAIDSSGNFYITGVVHNSYTSSNREFDFGANWGVDDIKSIPAGTIGLFVTKINNDFSYGWTKTICTGSSSSFQALSVDKDGNIFAGGNCVGKINFAADWGLTQEAGSATSDRHTFLMKINNDGTFGWVKSYGTTGDDYLSDIVCDENGYVYVSGKYITTQSSYSYAFLQKRAISNGSQAWVKHITWADSGFKSMPLVIDKDQNLYYSARVSGDVNFAGQWSNTDQRTGLNYNVYVTKINSSSEYQWTRVFPGTHVFDLVDDAEGNIYLLSQFDDEVDFAAEWDGVSDILDTGSFSTLHTAVTRINSDGSYGGTKALRFTDEGENMRICAQTDRLFIAGFFDAYSANANFNFAYGWGGEDFHMENGDGNAFIIKVNSDLSLSTD